MLSDDILALVFQEGRTGQLGGVSTGMMLPRSGKTLVLRGEKNLRHFNGLCLSKAQQYLTKSYFIAFDFMGGGEN